ncbi:hypothetical protein [Streptomyces deccanensis]|uniref:hypothetical protein n=1 Tax=Streptomyces deccanensis TaxID=424188 RepID=UPI001EFC0311|nr:hypothetical protein [Streptomyces deccanensis]ULR56375.1 hypothetical protein L3078_34930 [Streptomyces deccanensis]
MSEGAFDGVPAGVLEGRLSLPVVAGFLAATGSGGVLATELLDAGPVVGGCGAVLGAGTAWLTYGFGRALTRRQRCSSRCCRRSSPWRPNRSRRWAG